MELRKKIIRERDDEDDPIYHYLRPTVLFVTNSMPTNDILLFDPIKPIITICKSFRSEFSRRINKPITKLKNSGNQTTSPQITEASPFSRFSYRLLSAFIVSYPLTDERDLARSHLWVKAKRNRPRFFRDDGRFMRAGIVVAASLSAKKYMLMLIRNMSFTLVDGCCGRFPLGIHICKWKWLEW